MLSDKLLNEFASYLNRDPKRIRFNELEIKLLIKWFKDVKSVLFKINTENGEFVGYIKFHNKDFIQHGIKSTNDTLVWKDLITYASDIITLQENVPNPQD